MAILIKKFIILVLLATPMALENILEINAAILFQKDGKKASLPQIIEDFLSGEKGFSGFKTKLKEEKSPENDFLQGKDLLEKGKKAAYSPFRQFSDYISAFKGKLYGYYSNVKKAFKKAVDGVGYTDKLIKEIEDWGTIYFTTVSKRLQRLNPLGAMARYMEELWLYVGKKVK